MCEQEVGTQIGKGQEEEAWLVSAASKVLAPQTAQVTTNLGGPNGNISRDQVGNKLGAQMKITLWELLLTDLQACLCQAFCSFQSDLGSLSPCRMQGCCCLLWSRVNWASGLHNHNGYYYGYGLWLTAGAPSTAQHVCICHELVHEVLLRPVAFGKTPIMKLGSIAFDRTRLNYTSSSRHIVNILH